MIMARFIRVSEEQKQNIRTLRTDSINSVDSPASEESITLLQSTLKTAFSDRVITEAEFQSISDAVVKVTESTGVTTEESRVIFYDLQDIANTSRLPRTNDDLKGTDKNDTVFSGLGNDILTGAGTTAGVGQIDRLIGGGGKDTFVLGDTSQVFYSDGKTDTSGLTDYAVIADFNKKKDQIQLKGTATDYVLGAVPTSVGLTGTAIYQTVNGSINELIGVVSGVNVTDFSTGFTFV
jgi:Ca2+-binding RTX toxin-like protein